jgi:hypothetical protein
MMTRSILPLALLAGALGLAACGGGDDGRVETGDDFGAGAETGGYDAGAGATGGAGTPQSGAGGAPGSMGPGMDTTGMGTMGDTLRR